MQRPVRTNEKVMVVRTVLLKAISMAVHSRMYAAQFLTG